MLSVASPERMTSWQCGEGTRGAGYGKKERKRERDRERLVVAMTISPTEAIRANQEGSTEPGDHAGLWKDTSN